MFFPRTPKRIRDVPEIEADATTIRATVLAYLVPDNVGLGRTVFAHRRALVALTVLLDRTGFSQRGAYGPEDIVQRRATSFRDALRVTSTPTSIAPDWKNAFMAKSTGPLRAAFRPLGFKNRG